VVVRGCAFCGAEQALADAGGLLNGTIAGELLNFVEVEEFTIAVGRLNRVQRFDFQLPID
jgi:hypothetical protein